MDHQEDGHHGKQDDDESVARFEEFKKSIETKMAFRLSNLNPERPDSGFLRTLDSSIKRNTAVIKKLKQINEEQREGLLDELRGVNLSKFVSEAASAIRDAKLRTTDIQAAVQICSLLHQRYTDFSPSLVQGFLKVFFPGKSGDELDADRKAMKKRSTLKLLVELYFVGVIDDVGIFINIVKDLTSIENLKDRDATQWNLSLLSSFARQGRVFLGLSLSGQEIYEEFFKGLNITTEQTKVISRAFHTYYDAAAQLLLSEHSSLRQMEHDNSKILYAKGELSDENATSYEKLRKSYDHTYRGVSSLAEALDMQPPVMPEDSNTTRVRTGDDASSAASRKDSPVIESIWDDDDTRAFYECLPDLRAFVPAVLLGEAEPNVNEQLVKVNEHTTELAPEVKHAEVKTQESPDASADPDSSQEGKISEKVKGKEEKDKEREKGKEKNGDRKGESEKERLKGLDGTNLDALLQRLPGCVSRDLIDHLTVEFCYLNSKSSRKRLVKALFNVPRTSLELLSYYSRMVATLSTCMKDVSSVILQMLEEEFNFLINKKDQMNIETKVRNIRFLGELCKFKIAPAGLIFSCLKACLDDFSHHNIDVACNLLETCGRFLYRCPETSIRMANMLEILMRLKNVKNLDPRHSTLVENAYYFCKPPERSAHITKVRPPLHQYIRKLLFTDLDKSSIEHVLRQLRKLPWDDNDCENYLLKCFLKVHKGKYGQIHLIASLTAGLSRYHDTFAVAVVDEVLEEIRFGLELNDYGMHQRRLAHTRFLGELYNYKQLDSSIIFDTLYLILLFSHGAAEQETLDPPEDCFRIRMVITLLETCGHYFDRGSSKRKLDRFLTHFQRYILNKGVLPLDIEFDLQDIFADLRPNMTWYSSIEEVNAALIEIEENEQTICVDNKAKSEKQSLSENGGLHEEVIAGGESESDSRSDSVEQEGHGGEEDLEELNHEDEYGSEDDDNEDEDDDNEDEDVRPPFDEEDEVHVQQKVAKVDPEEEADFDREFKALMQESLESRKLEVRGRPGLNMMIPMKLLEGYCHESAAAEGGEEVGKNSDGSEVEVKVLMKRGNKQQTKQMCIPRDCSLLQSAKEKEAAELEEKQDIKRLILEYNEREEEDNSGFGGGSGSYPAMNMGHTQSRGSWGRGNVVVSRGGGGLRQRLHFGFSGGGGAGGVYYRRK